MRRLLLAILAVAAAAPPSGSVAQPGAVGPSIGLVPFLDMTGRAEGGAALPSLLERALAEKGFATKSGIEVERFLRNRRIRARNAMSFEESRSLAREIDVRYLMFGTIGAWASDSGPSVGLTIRILDTAELRTVYSEWASVDAPLEKGLIAALRPKTLEEAAARAVREALKPLSLQDDGVTIRPQRLRDPRRSALADKPLRFTSAAPDRPMRVAILPFQNRALDARGPALVAEHVTTWLRRIRGVEVVEPGELRRVLIEHDVQLVQGLGKAELGVLREALEVDAVLDGTILAFDGRGDGPPRIDLYARLRDARTGKELWAATTERDGEQTRTLYGAGRIREIDRLADGIVEDLLSTWTR